MGQSRHGCDGNRRAVGQATSPLVVHAHDAAPGVLGREKQGLGGEVGLHIAVVVQVVVLEVGEGGDVEDNPVNAIERQRMGGELDHRGTAVVLVRCREETGDHGCLGRRAHSLKRDGADAGFHGSAQGRVGETGGEGGSHEVRRGGLPVGSRHGHRGHARGGGGVDVATQEGDDGARIGHLHDGNAKAALERLAAADLVRDDQACPGLDRRVGKTHPVLSEARNRHEDPPRLAIVGRNGHAADGGGTSIERRGSGIGPVEAIDRDSLQGAWKRNRIDGGANVSHGSHDPTVVRRARVARHTLGR